MRRSPTTSRRLLDERGQASRDGFLEGAPPAPDAPLPLSGQKVGD